MPNRHGNEEGNIPRQVTIATASHQGRSRKKEFFSLHEQAREGLSVRNYAKNKNSFWYTSPNSEISTTSPNESCQGLPHGANRSKPRIRIESQQKKARYDHKDSHDPVMKGLGGPGRI